MSQNRVILRDADGLARIRHVVTVNATTVYVTARQGVIGLSEGGDTSRVVGFPRSDVFCDNPRHGIEEGKKVDWERLKNWS